jgi:hypothetical protein
MIELRVGLWKTADPLCRKLTGDVIDKRVCPRTYLSFSLNKTLRSLVETSLSQHSQFNGVESQCSCLLPEEMNTSTD